MPTVLTPLTGIKIRSGLLLRSLDQLPKPALITSSSLKSVLDTLIKARNCCWPLDQTVVHTGDHPFYGIRTGMVSKPLAAGISTSSSDHSSCVEKASMSACWETTIHPGLYSTYNVYLCMVTVTDLHAQGCWKLFTVVTVLWCQN